MPERIKRLVYLDGYLPENSKSAFDLIPGLKEVYETRSIKEQGKEWLVSSFDPTVWGVSDPDDVAWMNSRLCPMPWHTHDQSLRIVNLQAQKIPKSYISCTEYKNFHFMAQRARSQPGWDFHELKTGHDAMITLPDELVQILELISKS
jgi:hypothetical protein